MPNQNANRSRRNVVERLQVETLQGQYFFQGLYNREVYFDDFDDKSSDYFRLDYDPSFNFHAGRNLITIRGNSDTMVMGSELLLEATDAQGNLVATNIFDLDVDSHERVIAVDITPQTPAGDVIFTLIGSARVAPDGTAIPPGWRGRPNFKWTRVFTAKPHLPNKSPIVYNNTNQPQITINEISRPFYELSYNSELSGSIGWNGNTTSSYTLSSSFNTETQLSYKKSGDKYFVTAHDINSGSLLDFGGFTKDMTGGILIIKEPMEPRPSSINGYNAQPVYAAIEKGDGIYENNSYTQGAFMTSILEVMSPFEARVSSPHTTFQGNTAGTFQEFEHFEFAPSNYELLWSQMPISYSSSPTGSQGEDLRTSYAHVRFDNLEPLTGDVTRIKCYMKNHQAPFDWVLASDNAVWAQELLYRGDSTAKKHRMPVGDFSQWGIATGTGSLEQYWETEGVGCTAPSMSIYTQGGAGENPPVEDNLLIGDNAAALELDGTAFWWLHCHQSASFYQDQWYELSLKAVSIRTLPPTWTTMPQNTIVEPKMKIYITGSAFTDGTDDYGKYLGKIEDTSIRKKHVEFDEHDDFKEVGYKFVFKADGTEEGVPKFKIDSGIWHIWDVSIKPWDRKGYTPGTWDVIFPTVKCNVGTYDSLDFKFEFYNDYGEISNYTAVVEKVPWQNEYTMVFTHIHTNLLNVVQTASFDGVVEFNGTVALFTASDGTDSGTVYWAETVQITGSENGVQVEFTESTGPGNPHVFTIYGGSGGGGVSGVDESLIGWTASDGGGNSGPVGNGQTMTIGTSVATSAQTSQQITYTPGSRIYTLNLYNKEAIQDIVGAMVQGNTETGITVSYDDGSGTLDFVTSVTGDPGNDDGPGTGCVTNWPYVPGTSTGGGDLSDAERIPGFGWCTAGFGMEPNTGHPQSGTNLGCPTTVGYEPAAYVLPSYSAEYFSGYAEKTWLQINNWSGGTFQDADGDVKYAAIFNTTGNPVPWVDDDPCKGGHHSAGHGVKIMTSTIPIGIQFKQKQPDNSPNAGTVQFNTSCATYMSKFPGPMVGSSYLAPSANEWQANQHVGGLPNAYYLAFYHWHQDVDFPMGQQSFAGGIRKHCNSYKNTIVIEYVSDRRLKENIEETRWCVDDLMKIKVRDYDYKATPEDRRTSKETGFIAQELQEVYPEAAFGNEYGDISKEPMTVAPDKLIPLMVKSIQDQQNIINELKQKIEKLENK